MAEIFPNMMKTIIHISKNFNELLPQKKKQRKKYIESTQNQKTVSKHS